MSNPKDKNYTKKEENDNDLPKGIGIYFFSLKIDGKILIMN